MANWSRDEGARHTPDGLCVWTEGPGPAEAPSTTATLPARKHPDAQTATVLIVDDDLAAVDTFAQALRLEGYEVRTALSVEKRAAHRAGDPS
jgi:hypothetical protein